MCFKKFVVFFSIALSALLNTKSNEEKKKQQQPNPKSSSALRFIQVWECCNIAKEKEKEKKNYTHTANNKLHIDRRIYSTLIEMTVWECRVHVILLVNLAIDKKGMHTDGMEREKNHHQEAISNKIVISAKSRRKWEEKTKNQIAEWAHNRLFGWK